MASRWQKTKQNVSHLTNLLGSTYTLLTRQALPTKNGTLQLAGLHAPVDIVTDNYGIPHIYALTEDDLYFAQGYVHAQDRLWQLEFNRRLSSGRLSELFGAQTLEIDRFCRRLGMHRAAAAHTAQLPTQAKRFLAAYANGVNAFIATNSHKLPVEFGLLHCTPAPWQITDTLQWSKMQAWSLGGNWETELIRARLVAKLGPERAAILEPGYDPTHPLIIPSGVSFEGVNLDLLTQYQQIKQQSGFSAMGGSNNWVIDGTKTVSGLPMLCNDPHLGLGAPSIWYECHLVTPDLDVTGASFPGSPGIIIGHNQQIAWGVTNAVSDVQDLYIEKFNPENPHQYEFMGQWEQAEVIREEIVVKDQADPVVEEVRVTRHGPILTTLTQTTSNPQNDDSTTIELPLALRWTALDQANIVSAVYELNRATNWDEFKAALRGWDAPAQNFVYADQAGNIGYLMAGAIPIRAQGQALIPSPGWTGTYEWTGQIPFEELPQVYNPEQHYVVTANNRVVDESYPYYITHEWLNGYRAQRISDLLSSKDKLSSDDMATIQSDQYALPALSIVPYILQLEADTPLKRAIHEVLQTWDYQLSPTSIAALIYTTFLRKLERIILDALLGDDEQLLQHYLGASSSAFAIHNGYATRSKPFLIRLLAQQDDDWFAHSALPNGPTSWPLALHRAFDATIEELSTRLGHNILNWQYGTRHAMTYKHVLGIAGPLENLFNRGPFPIGGDNDTINVSNSSPANPAEVLIVPSYRQIIDLAHLPNSRSIHAPGQSGHPNSPHYADFIPLWRNGQYHPMFYQREQIDAQAEGTLHLTPANQNNLLA